MRVKNKSLPQPPLQIYLHKDKETVHCSCTPCQSRAGCKERWSRMYSELCSRGESGTETQEQHKPSQCYSQDSSSSNPVTPAFDWWTRNSHFSFKSYFSLNQAEECSQPAILSFTSTANPFGMGEELWAGRRQQGSPGLRGCWGTGSACWGAEQRDPAKHLRGCSANLAFSLT